MNDYLVKCPFCQEQSTFSVIEIKVGKVDEYSDKVVFVLKCDGCNAFLSVIDKNQIKETQSKTLSSEEAKNYPKKIYKSGSPIELTN
jgi:predicted metal-binding protein